MIDYVVDFTLPGDAALFIHHGCNVVARNTRDAIRQACDRFPEARIRGASPGIVCLYGAPFATWDSTLGAECAPSRKGDWKG